jgi:DNA-binding FrmR family transcriptional regulator
MTTHSSYPDIIKRLKRAQGHLNSTIAMLEKDRKCVEIAQQLLAVENAINSAKRTLVHDHIDHCLGDAMQVGSVTRAPLDELKQITKYL